MTAVAKGSYLQAVSYPAATDRRLMRSTMGGRGGVVRNTATFTDLKVTQRGAGANMSVDVAEGTVYITGTQATYQGLYHGDNQGATNVVITAANATNPRKDLIVARIQDSEYSGSTDTFTIEVKTGAPAASPADPTVDANCIVLARVAVAANASSITNANVTDLRVGYAAVTGSSVIGNQTNAAALGGVVVCTSSFRPTVGLYEGLVAYETDTGRIITYNGTAWITQPFVVSNTDSASAQIANAGFSDPTITGSPGPAVSLLTGTKVLVTVGANMTTDAMNGIAQIGVAVTGASTVAASSAKSVMFQTYTSGAFTQTSHTFEITGLTPGVNTFTCKYKGSLVVAAATFTDRRIAVQTAL